MPSAWRSRKHNSPRATTAPVTRSIDHYTYALVSDGDLMEGVGAEAASLAGHLKLGKLICLYDDNHITLSAGTDITFTEDRAARFRAYGWHTHRVEDGNDLAAIERALIVARAEARRPSLILVRTHIGYGSPEQDTFKAHGSPLGERRAKTKQKLGWPTEPAFLVPDAALAHFREALERGARAEATGTSVSPRTRRLFPNSPRNCRAVCAANYPQGWDAGHPDVSGRRRKAWPRASHRAKS